MKGSVTIEAVVEDGREVPRVSTDLHEVNFMDKLHMMHCLCKSLKIQPKEFTLMATMLSSGIMDEMVDQEVLMDGYERVNISELLKFLRGLSE